MVDLEICPKCGKYLKEGAIRCINCGSYIDDDENGSQSSDDLPQPNGFSQSTVLHKKTRIWRKLWGIIPIPVCLLGVFYITFAIVCLVTVWSDFFIRIIGIIFLIVGITAIFREDTYMEFEDYVGKWILIVIFLTIILGIIYAIIVWGWTQISH